MANEVPNKEPKRPQTIVAECVRTWELSLDGSRRLVDTSDLPPLISGRFELICRINEERGYQLRSWQMTSVPIAGHKIVETIIAVFERFPPLMQIDVATGKVSPA